MRLNLDYSEVNLSRGPDDTRLVAFALVVLIRVGRRTKKRVAAARSLRSSPPRSRHVRWSRCSPRDPRSLPNRRLDVSRLHHWSASDHHPRPSRIPLPGFERHLVRRVEPVPRWSRSVDVGHRVDERSAGLGAPQFPAIGDTPQRGARRSTGTDRGAPCWPHRNHKKRYPCCLSLSPHRYFIKVGCGLIRQISDVGNGHPLLLKSSAADSDRECLA
jgi:hypothetical protein